MSKGEIFRALFREVPSLAAVVIGETHISSFFLNFFISSRVTICLDVCRRYLSSNKIQNSYTGVGNFEISLAHSAKLFPKTI